MGIKIQYILLEKCAPKNDKFYVMYILTQYKN